MANPLSRHRRLYLRRELHTVHGAVEAARMLSEAVATDQLGPDRDHRRAPRAIASLLVLVGERLQYLRRSARHPSDPPEELAQVATDPPEELAQVATDPPEELAQAISDPPEELAQVASDPPEELTEVASDPPEGSWDERLLAMCARQQRARGSRVARAA